MDKSVASKFVIITYILIETFTQRFSILAVIPNYDFVKYFNFKQSARERR